MSSAHELALTESKTLRSQYRDRTDVLDRVKGLATLPGNEFATTAHVADFYDVPVKTIESVVEDNRAELEASGFRRATRAEVKAYNEAPREGGSKANRLNLFSRTAVLNVGMLLTGSETARQVRAYLLAVETTATTEHRATAVELVRLQERQDYRNVLHALKLGGAASEEYQLVQNTLYVGLFGKTAAQIRASQPQRTGVPLKRGSGFRKSTVAKDYLTESQLSLLNSTVLAIVAQIQIRHPDGATAAEMVAAVNGAVSLMQPHRIGA